MRLRGFGAAFVLTLALALVLPAQAPTKKRVAVFDFEYATLRSTVAGIFGTDVDIGRGVTDLLVQRLVKDGIYSVIERKALEKILTEQNFSNSDRADSSTAAKIGRVLGVDVIILGSITQFGRDDKNVGVAGGALGGAAGRFGLGGVRRNESKAVVGLTGRMIDTSTGEILAAVTGKGESTRGGVAMLGAGGSSGGVGAGATDMGSSNFAQTILGEATGKAVGEIATQMGAQAAVLPQRVIKVEGLVADVAGDNLILNVGTKAGVRVGNKLQVRRMVREIKDPATGKVIRSIEDTLGEVTITEADEASSVGKYSGNPVKVGDQVRNEP